MVARTRDGGAVNKYNDERTGEPTLEVDKENEGATEERKNR
jgi:hypothetical protein